MGVAFRTTHLSLFLELIQGKLAHGASMGILAAATADRLAFLTMNVCQDAQQLDTVGILILDRPQGTLTAQIRIFQYIPTHPGEMDDRLRICAATTIHSGLKWLTRRGCQILVVLDNLAGDRPRFTGSYNTSINFDNRHDFGSRPGEKTLVRIV